MDGHRGGEGPAGEHAGPADAGPAGSNGAFVASEATNAPFVPPEAPENVAAIGTARTPAGVLVESGRLPDGRAIRFFSWAAARESPSMSALGGPADSPRDTREEGGR